MSDAAAAEAYKIGAEVVVESTPAKCKAELTKDGGDYDAATMKGFVSKLYDDGRCHVTFDSGTSCIFPPSLLTPATAAAAVPGAGSGGASVFTFDAGQTLPDGPEDPRSPTAQVPRTPVAEVPEFRGAGDPRSPTISIPRTPFVGKGGDIPGMTAIGSSAEDPRSPVLEGRPTPW